MSLSIINYRMRFTVLFGLLKQLMQTSLLFSVFIFMFLNLKISLQFAHAVSKSSYLSSIFSLNLVSFKTFVVFSFLT